MIKKIKTNRNRIMESKFFLNWMELAIIMLFINLLFSCQNSAKLDIENVRNFGAIGDGKADDTEAIQKAIDAGTGVIYFPKGVYQITKPIVINLDSTGYTSISGDGVAQIVMAGSGPALCFIGSHFKSAGPSDFSENVWKRQRMPLVEGIAIVGDHPEAEGIEAVGTMQLTLHRILIRKVLHGIHFVRSNRNIIISDCHIYDNKGVGIYFDDVNQHQTNIIGCQIFANKGGGIVSLGGNVRNIQITGCDIEANMDPQMASTANVLIDCSESDYGTAEVTITGCTIQHNIIKPDNNSSLGSANIRIIGRNKPNAKGESFRWGNICITGNIMSDVWDNIHLKECYGVTITGNTFWESYRHSLLIEKCFNILVASNTVDFAPAFFKMDTLRYNNSLAVYESQDCTFSGLHITNLRYDQAAFLLDNCSRMNITDCSILDFDNVGLLLKNVSDSRVSDCIISDKRPNTKSIPLKIEGGKGNMIVDILK